MFNKLKYATQGINLELNIRIQMMLWGMIDKLDAEKDYLQVFEITQLSDETIKIHHKQEEPEYHKEYLVAEKISKEFVKVFVIDDGDYATMLLASEY